MPHPTQTRPVEMPQKLTPPEDIIESVLKERLDRENEAVQDPSSSAPDLDDPSAMQPLSWEEIIPTQSEIKDTVSKSLMALGGVTIVVSLSVLAFRLFPMGWTAKTTPPPPAENTAETLVQPVHLTRIPTPAPTRAPKVASQPTEQVTTPATPVEPSARAVPAVAGEEQPAPVPAPENLTARFFSPAMIELSWTPVDENYRYRLYSAPTASMAGARLEFDAPIVNSHFAWTPTTDARSLWLAVTSVDPQGKESYYSRPLFIRLH